VTTEAAPDYDWLVARNREQDAEIAMLQRQLGDVAERSLVDGYDQAVLDMHDVVGVTQEVTRVLGPSEGLTYLLERLREKDIPVGFSRNVPYDWLDRWKVELAP
jgi:hypothetical protein